MTTSVNWRTPNLTVIDSRGLPIRQVGYLRKVAAGPVEPLIGRQRYDAAGRLFEQSDPRLVGGVPNLATVYRLSGEPLKVSSVDAGWRLSLPGPAGEALQRWDQRGNHWRTTYDLLLRPIAIEENGEPNVETFTYADAAADPAFNLRRQLTRQLDRSGTLSFDSYSLLGQPLRETRTLAEGKPYVSSRMYSPIGTVLSQTDAGEHQQQSRYDIAGQLKQVQLRIKGSPNWQPVLKDAQYNAAGQITEQRAGNDVLSTWTYDPADGRLCMQRAQKTAEPALQDLQYFYDRVGNITRLEDHTFQPIYFANQLVDGHRDFTYDSLYRLTRASGYDDALPSDVPGRPSPGDPNNRLNYQQHYDYDHGGNLIELRHVRAGASHTNKMIIDPTSNRGVRWKDGDPAPVFPELFDVHGNLQHLQPGKALQWNSLDQLESVTLVKRTNAANDEEFYRYSQGVRVYKRHETHTSSLTHFQEVVYLPGLEIRTRDNGEELHVITLPGGHGSVRCLHWVTGKPVNIAADQARYSLDDHLGSCALELDQNAQVISQEGYYPFGATAWYARGREVDVDYKTIRYSGKEMDDSGLYYYGLRYYAPWLQRWINPDPLGAVDGLNLYRMVGNNPINFVDDQGGMMSPALQKHQQTIIPMGSSSSSSNPSIESNMMSSSGSHALVFEPGENPPGKLPPEPAPEGSLLKRATLWAVNSKVGLALSPVATSSPASALVVSTVLTAAVQFSMSATLFNPNWSPPGSWNSTGDGSIPHKDVTQNTQSIFNMTTIGVTAFFAVAGTILGPIVGGYVDELRGTKAKAEKKAKAGEMSTNINKLIAEQRLLENVTQKAQDSLHEQVLEVESLIGITWNTMEMLEKIQKLRPAIDSASGASSRRSSAFSQASINDSLRQRQLNRTRRLSSNSSMHSARE
ncbi:RHS repeat-associated core domain containing protein-containing protein [Pseudomonas sp. GM41(2012)]|uniref:RHS repeat domain-containing protein n=1 Tax=Pseudomonas sp. (strain GM41(2012)) TaxID=1144708 RepID=UPI00026FF07A|nr:RHS repeat-associated core domain-containing protein [Pseudomonas sp. GM41(2012)]EUB71180.1 RHS repeat-associated core domain containing protein-containing protein [Pseudomonas sp. GM41(2012)]